MFFAWLSFQPFSISMGYAHFAAGGSNGQVVASVCTITYNLDEFDVSGTNNTQIGQGTTYTTLYV